MGLRPPLGRTVKVIVIYSSGSRAARLLGERIRDACDADLVVVRQIRRPHPGLALYLLGGIRALCSGAGLIEPGSIDVSSYHRIVICTPGRVGRPVNAMERAIGALAGCEGKGAVVCAISGSPPDRTLAALEAALAERGVRAIGGFAFTPRDLGDPRRIDALLSRITGRDGGEAEGAG